MMESLRSCTLWFMGSLAWASQRGLLDIIEKEEENSQRKLQDMDIGMEEEQQQK